MNAPQNSFAWHGHVSRMEDHHLPEIMLYGELSTEHRDKGPPQKRYKDTLKKVPSSAGSIPKISKYRDTCESSIPIFSGIAILRYFWYRTPTIRYLRYLRYFDTRHRVHSTKSMRRRNIVVDDDVVYGSYHYSASQPKLT